MAVVSRGIGLVATFAVLGTALYLVYRYNKKKDVCNNRKDAMAQISSSSSSQIPRPSKFGNEVHQVSGAIHHTQVLPDFSSGLEKRVEDVKNMLEKGTSQATVLGIVGMGGIGKTTLAKQLFNETSVEYEYICFVDNVKGIPIHNLTDCLLTQFHRHGVKVEKMEWSHLKDKRTLIVMDDVDSEDQLQKLPKLHDFGGDSHLIITSRVHNVCDVFSNCPLYDIGFLNDDEAKELLCQHAFGLDKIPKYLMEKDHQLGGCVDGLVLKCQGLPLTLEVMGRYLQRHNNNVGFWTHTIEKLGEAQSVDGRENDRVLASLKVSYDDLAEEEKEMFIEAGTCFFEQPLEKALEAWSGSNVCVEITWESLIRRSLVKVMDGEIWVHEHLRDLAKKVSGLCMVSIYDVNTLTRLDLRAAILMKSEEKVRRGSVRRIVDVWFEAGVTKIEDRRGLDLDMTWSERRLNHDGSTSTVQLESLEHMESLKYLYLDDLMLKGLMKNFPRNLSVLKWTLPVKGPLSLCPELPGISWKGMRKLGVLELQSWKVQTEFLEALGHLTNLRILRLGYLVGLDFLPEEFGNLSCLQQLTLERSSLSTLPDSLGDLGALKYLSISRLPILELPGSFGSLHSLIRLKLDSCRKLGSLPESFGHLSSLKELIILGCDRLEILPGSFGLLASLEHLKIVEPSKLKRLPDNFGELTSLKKLTIEGAPNLEALSNSFGELSSLTHLELLNCPSLEELPESFGKLSSLEELTLEGCSRFQRLPDNFSELKSLKKLKISGASNLEALSNSFGELSSLTHLELLNCPSLEELPESFEKLSSLEELTLEGCSRFQRLPDNFSELKSLKKLKISGASNLKALSKSFGKLSSLTHLELLKCPSLEELPKSFGKLSSLEELTLEGCSRFQRLPDNFSELKSLKKLKISGASNLEALTIEEDDQLEALSSCLRELTTLRHLTLVNVSTFSTLPDSIGYLTSLVTLTITSCKNLESLPPSFVSFGHPGSSRELVLHRCTQLTKLPDIFDALMMLTIEEDDQLEALSSCLRELTTLRRLTLVNVSTFSTLPDSIGYLTSLVTLMITSCENLESLPPSFVSFGHDPGFYRELVLHRCTQLTKLPDIFGPLMILTIEEDDQLEALSSCLRELTTLRHLTLINVSSVELPESLLDGLVMLTIRSCQTLSCLPSSFGRLSSLKELYIENCPLFSTLQGREPDDFFEIELGDSIQVPWGWFISLENLTLSGCRITSELLCAMLDTIMRVFVTSLALTRLDLHDNLLEDQAFQILLTWADHLQHLKELDLSMNRGMNSSGLMSLIETIQSGHLPSLQRVNWVGNRYSDATAQAVTQAYYENESLTTYFDVDWTSASDISLGPKVEEYRDRNVRLKDLKEKLKSEEKPKEDLHEALPLSSAEGLEEELDTEDNVQVNVSKEKLKTEDKPKEELHEDLPLSSAKVFLCGYPEVGKTTLRKTLFDPLRSWWFSWRKEPRTRGIELSRVEEMKENEDSLTLVLWDLAGQEEFHVLHSSFFPDLGLASGKATTFVLVFNAAWKKEVKEEIKYWLGFAASSSLTHAKRHVMIVLNQFGGKQCTDDDLQLWKNLVKLFAKRFDDLLQIHSDPIIIDARDPQSVQPLKDRLFNHARKLLENVMVPGVCIQLQQVLKEWAQGDKKTHLPLLSWQSFESILLSKHKRTEWSGELLRTSALYLHEIGEIIYFDNKKQTGAGSEHRGLVVPEPQWFCRHIVGELLLPERMLKGERPIEVSSYGSISMIEFKSFFMNKLPEGTGEDDVISMLEQMGLGYKKGAEEIIIPALISEDNTSKFWEGQGFLWVMGRCLTTEDMERLPIPSILFRKLQAELAQNFGDRVDSKYIAGKSFSNFTDGEHLVLIEFGLKPSDRACGRVDILVKTIQESEKPKVRWAQIECISRIMKKLESLCVKYCPGVKYDIKVMEPWNACDKTPRMVDRNVMSLKRIKNLLREGNDYSGWRLNKGQKEVAVKYEWLLSNSEWKEARKEDPSKSTGIKFSAVNDSLYELHTPPLDTTPNMEILFFHGIREEGGSEEAHFSTWESGDKSCIWPQKWLAETFPRARILFVYFDSVVKGKSGSLRFDMDLSDTYLITENLATDLTQGHVGQTLNRPVIMVGHCLGGMVIKELLLRVFSGSNFTTDTSKFKRLMNNVRGIFYYDTPHHGTILEPEAGLDVANNNLLRYFQALDERAARVNDEFAKLRRTFPKWRIGGLGAKLPTNSVLFRDNVVVPEASSREGDCFNMIDEDHYSICKPESKITKSFTSLETVIKDILVDMQPVDTVQ